MAKYVSLTAIGADKPGIVSALTKVLYALKCNIEESTMTILRGKFAMILIVKLPSGVEAKNLLSKLKKPAKSLEMSLSCSEISSFSSSKTKDYVPYVISVYGGDKTGIVYNVSEFLAEKGANITDVQTAVSKNKGAKTYIMVIEAGFPKTLSQKDALKELSVLAESLNVSVSINRAESAEI